MKENKVEDLSWLIWLSHGVPVVVFSVPAFLYLWDDTFEITWPFVVVLTLLCSPFLIILLHRYISAAKGLGVEIQMRQSGIFTETTATSPSTQSATPALTYSQHSPAAQKVLRTLWTFQRGFFGINELTKKWGLIIGSGANDYAFFVSGASELVRLGFIGQNPNGLFFLTTSGVQHCIAVQAQMDSIGGDIWSTFTPA